MARRFLRGLGAGLAWGLLGPPYGYIPYGYPLYGYYGYPPWGLLPYGRRRGKARDYGKSYDYGYEGVYDYGDYTNVQGMEYYEPEKFLEHVAKTAPNMELEDLKHAKYGIDALHREAMSERDEESIAFFSKMREIIDESIADHYGVPSVHDIPSDNLLPKDVKEREDTPQPKLLDSSKTIHDPEHVMAQYIEQAKDLKRHLRRKYLGAKDKEEEDGRSFIDRDFNYRSAVGEYDHLAYQYISAGFMHRMFARGYLKSGREAMEDLFWGKEEYSKDYLKNLGNGIQKSLRTQVNDWDAGIDYAILRGSLIRLEMEREDAGTDEVDPSRAREFFKSTSSKFKTRWHSILREHIQFEKKAIDTLLAQSKDSISEEDFFKSDKSRKEFENAKSALHGKVADDVTNFWSDVIHCSFGNSKEDPISKDIKDTIRDAWVQHVDATLDFTKNMVMFHSDTAKAKRAESQLYENGDALAKTLNHYVYLDMGLSAPKRRVQSMYQELFA